MALLSRVFKVFGDARLAGISPGHFHDLRHSKAYVRVLGNLDGTRPEGRPGWVRVDSVHQGDLDKVKGVYHVNAVETVTQYQFTGCVERISERYLVPVLERLLESFPFVVQAFHSDNGSEYVNYQVAALLEKLRVEEFTKSRPRRSNDNAWAESKSGSVIRKQFGYGHIPGRYAGRLDGSYREALDPYLNYHRPCLFPRVETDAKGKQRKVYRQAHIRTPYERFKALPEAASNLRPDVSFLELDREPGVQTPRSGARGTFRGVAGGGLGAVALQACPFWPEPLGASMCLKHGLGHVSSLKSLLTPRNAAGRRCSAELSFLTLWFRFRDRRFGRRR